ncbi:MAG: S8 family serine peptidase [Thermoleophilia bacterium]|nr:S8 family serine peptidase [Thermoleophilia bacterium]
MIVRRGLAALLPLVAAGALAASAGARPEPGPEAATVQVIVELAPPPAARAGFGHPGRGRQARRALAAIDAAQRALTARIHASIPGAEVRWRYRIVLDGLAVTLPAASAGRLAAVPGVVNVYPSARYHALSGNDGPALIGAPAVWGDSLATAGRGLRIGIIDDGIDASHPYFSPAGYALPPGFPKGRRAFTTAKVIVARAFAPAGTGWRNASRPFDPVYSFHGTHVAGIAAGNHGTAAGGVTVSGVAPLAYLGNYKALTTPTDSGVGLNGNSPELVAAIEAAVADGMDVINLSLGEPELEPGQDVVAQALDNAALAGVVPVVAAGNDYLDLGRGSIGSPGTAAGAITVAATAGAGPVASFSASGPTPFALLAKPEVSAPGVDVLSAYPGGAFVPLSGTSMAAPHVAGAAALLLELHPEWTPARVKSALVLSGRPVRSGSGAEALATRQGGGLADLPAAAAVPAHASPQSIAFGLVDVSAGGHAVERQVELDGTGTWSVSVETQQAVAGTTVTAPATAELPGTLTLRLTAAADTREAELSGFVVLEREGARLRLPWWGRVTRPALPQVPATALERTGTYEATVAGAAALVDAYRYPDGGRTLPGPEVAFRVTVTSPVANLGVAVVETGAGVDVEPRIVAGSDENRLAGATALPAVTNPYLTSFRMPVPVAAALRPAPGTYTVVFDTRSAAVAGPFRFRLWLSDTTPPRVTLLSHRASGGRILARVRDAGSGVDPSGIVYSLDGGPPRAGTLDRHRRVVILDVSGLRPGSHRLRLRVSDRQELKNTENVAGLLPNTRVVETEIVVR